MSELKWVNTLKNFGLFFVSVGTIWLTLYFAVIVHAFPAVDLSKAALAIGGFGAFGTFFYLCLFIIFIGSTLFIVILRDNRKDSFVTIEWYRQWLTTKATQDPYLITKGNRRGATLPVIFAHYLSLFILVTLGSLFPDNLPKWPLLILLCLAPGIAAVVVDYWQTNKTGLFRTPKHTMYLFSIYVLSAFVYLLGLILLQHFFALPATYILWLAASLSTVCFVFLLYPPLSLIISLLMILLLPAVSSSVIISVPARWFNIGSQEKLFTALSHGSAQAIEDCGVLPENRRRTKTFSPSRHYALKVLSELGDDYVLDCRMTNGAIILPKTELASVTVDFSQNIGHLSPSFSSTSTSWPTAEFSYSDNRRTVSIIFNLPGCHLNDISVTPGPGSVSLVVAGEKLKSSPFLKEDDSPERLKCNKFERVITIPDEINQKSITHNFAENVLRITMDQKK